MHIYGMHVNLPGIVTDSAPSAPLRTFWQPVALRFAHGPEPATTHVVFDSARALLLVKEHLTLEVTREDWVASFRGTRPIGTEELVHPLLAFVGAAVARWTGRSAFHAAAAVLGDRAWLLLAPPGGGKSTAAAALAKRGHIVLSDDLAVIEESMVLAGPRSADLRQGAARHLGSGRPTARRSNEPRWRHDLGPTPLGVELGGLFSLNWGETLSIAKVPTAERLQILGTHEALAAGPTSPTSFLDLLAFPFYTLTRPRRWDDLEATLDLLELTAAGPKSV